MTTKTKKTKKNKGAPVVQAQSTKQVALIAAAKVIKGTTTKDAGE